MLSKFHVTTLIRKNKEDAISLLSTYTSAELEKLQPEITKVANPIETLILIKTDKMVDAYFNILKRKEYFSKEGLEKFKKHRQTNKNSTSNNIELIYDLYPKSVAESVILENRKKHKNIYDPKYIAKRDNISIETAKIKIKKFKKDKATSKENFIKKYGKSVGEERYKKFYDETLRTSNDKEAWIKKHNSNEAGWNLRCRSINKFCVEYWIKLGLSYSEAKYAVSDHQKYNAGISYSYYERMGYSDFEIKQILLEISKKQDGCSLEGIRNKNPDFTDQEILDRYEEICKSKSHPISLEAIAKTRKTMEIKGIWSPLELLGEYEKYRRKVSIVTDKQPISQLINYDKRGRTGIDGAYHLDHRYSISMGFLHKIDPKIIGNIVNLEFLPWKDNISKNWKCSITQAELLKEYYSNENN